MNREIFPCQKPRKPRVSKAQRKWLSIKPCIFCGVEPQDPDTEGPPPHHDREIGPCGMNLKPSDTYMLPTCNDCHGEIHTFSKAGEEMLKRVGKEERMAAMLDYNDEWMAINGI